MIEAGKLRRGEGKREALLRLLIELTGLFELIWLKGVEDSVMKLVREGESSETHNEQERHFATA